VRKGNSYSVAFVREDGGFDVLERFIALDDDEANDYAERCYAGQEWFVLDSRGRNINGGEQP
jgi:hypothetical protein